MPKRYLSDDLKPGSKTIDVGHGTRFATPFGNQYVADSDASAEVSRFKDWLLNGPKSQWWDSSLHDFGRWGNMIGSLPMLRGKDVADRQPLDRPSHADVLLEIANGPTLPVISVEWVSAS